MFEKGTLFVFEVMLDLVRLKVAPLHPLLRRSAALAYTRRWWSYLAVGAQSAAIDCILGRDPQVWVPHGEPPLAAVLADAAQQRPELPPRHRVHARRRLI